MTFPWKPISQAFSEAGAHYDVIVVGSGYGGGVAASRLARTGKNVAVLERGREIAPGDYPRDMVAAKDEMQVRLSRSGRRIGQPDALYDFRVGDDVNVLLGCGLGGTSLINANVAIEPDKRIYKDWPKPYRDDPTLLDDYFDRARAMLGSRPYPKGKTPPKLAALEKVGAGLKAEVKRPDLNVTFEAGYNSAGIWQDACTDCGDCVSGCNYGAKNTVLMNYLPDAERNGASIFTGAEVVAVERITGEENTGRWAVLVHDTGADPDRKLHPRKLTADVVVLAAGTLGTTEILLRSRDHGLSLSDKLGRQFSTNGDVWAFGYNANMPAPDTDDLLPVYGVGAGEHEVFHGPPPDGGEKYKPGPCITGCIDLRDATKPLEDGLIIEEGVMPGALATGYAAVFPMLDALMGDPFRFDDTPRRLKDAEALGQALLDDPMGFAETAYTGPVSRTIPYLVMSHDASDGVLELNEGTVRVLWADAGLDTAFLKDDAVLKRGSDSIKAEYLPNPLWQDAFGNRVVTVHPLGGCAMADDCETGVLDERCRVFNPDGGVHKGLYVVDGAAIPKGVGVNPHLVITAVAERAVELLAADHEWKIARGSLDPQPPFAAISPKPTDIAEQLSALIAGITQIKQAIDNRAWELAVMLLKGVWRQVENAASGDKTAEYLVRKMKKRAKSVTTPDQLEKTVGPILGLALDVLIPAETALSEGDFGKVLALAEGAFGDFSPQVNFPEAMTGHISDVALGGSDQSFDPFEAAGTGAVNTWFTAQIAAPAVRSAITPGATPAAITSGELRSDFLGGRFKIKDGTGTFRFLEPNTDKIEAWEMIYEAQLSEVGGPRSLHFRGKKTLQLREGSHWWRDLTALRVEISDPDGPVAQGMLHVGFEDLMEQAKALDISYREDDLNAAACAVFVALSCDWTKELLNLFKDNTFKSNCVKTALLVAGRVRPELDATDKLAKLYAAKTFARMGGLVLRTYGGLFSYMMNFPAQADLASLPRPTLLPDAQVFYPETTPGVYLKLTRYNGGPKGPVILAGGFGTKASSFALTTVDKNIVEALVEREYDVWLFDYRGSGDIAASLDPFTLDDVAKHDWPAAIEMVTRRTGKPDVQVLVHCIGSMSLFMAVLAGETRVRSILSSQLGPHAITNWFNFAKGDAHIATAMAHGFPEPMIELLKGAGLSDDLLAIFENGLDVVDPRSPLPATDLDQTIDGMLWNIPSFSPVSCLSPTCHRINAIFGPSYRHAQLNQATHNAISDLFGPVSTAPFIHIAKIFREGRVVSADGTFDYLAHPDRLRMPIHFIAGGRNQEMLPEATLRTLAWLRRQNPSHQNLYSRAVYPEYGHMDCFIGKSAADDIFGELIDVLDQTAHGTSDA